MSPGDADTLIVDHLYLVKRVVQRLRRKYGLDEDPDDLVAAGHEGLIDAATRFDPERGVPFGAYARIRIRGAVLDYVRAMTWVPRREQGLRKALNRHPSLEKVAESIGLSTKVMQGVARRASCQMVPWSTLSRSRLAARGRSLASDAVRSIADGEFPPEGVEDPNWVDPSVALDASLVLSKVKTWIHRLPRNERIAVSMYHLQGKDLEEIATHLGVSPSRVCQIRKSGEQRLRHMMRRVVEEMIAV